jgi:tetratricopeptide (TPR) repeat protein
MAILILYPKTPNLRTIQLDKPSIVIGSAPNSDVCLENESISDCHARIEHKEDGYYLSSLAPGVFVNGTEITFYRLINGDQIEIADVIAEFMCSDDEALGDRMPALRAGTQLANSQHASEACPQCGLPVELNARFCPHCGLPRTSLPAARTNMAPASTRMDPLPGPGSLPVIAFLLSLTVVGAPLSLALGLITLSIIRRRGGTSQDRALAKWAVGLSYLWIVVGVLALAGWIRNSHLRDQREKIATSETQVIGALKDLACAQKYAHTVEFFDIDGDGVGEYGELLALLDVHSPFFDADLADGEAYDYQFSIQNPSEGRFLAVAEPLRYDLTGGRTFEIDQSGQIRGGDTKGVRYAQLSSPLPILQGVRSAFDDLDDEIAKDVLNFAQSLAFSPENEERKQRILKRLREDYSLTSVASELGSMEKTTNRFVAEQRAEAVYLEAQTALEEDNSDVAFAKLSEIMENHPTYSKIAAVERELSTLRSKIAQDRERAAKELFVQAEEGERQGLPQEEVQELFQRIEKLYPDTEVAARVLALKPELNRQMRETMAEEVFSELMGLSPESDYEKILNQANQLRRNYGETDFFAKVESALNKQERKASAISWRVKTQANMEAGEMRGALAQLESAMRENPDLQYDLRDLCTELYLRVAELIMKEGDARGALDYYTKANRQLQASGGQEVSPDILAKLHNDVGMADYERKDYEQARGHLTSAAWKYQEDAQFNMRLGAANLYSGLYQPAESALKQALTLRPDMEPALLYRAYLNIRIALMQERVLAGVFTLQDATETQGNARKEPVSATPQQQQSSSFIYLGNEGERVGGVVLNSPREEATLDAPKDLDLKYSNDAGSELTRLAASALDGQSPVPYPTDIDLFLSFDYQSSSRIVPALLQFLEGFAQQRTQRQLAVEKAKEPLGYTFEGDVIEAPASVIKAAKLESERSEKESLAEFSKQLGQLQLVTQADLTAQEELLDLLEEIKQRYRTALSDMQSVRDMQPNIRFMAERVQSQINKKYELISEAETSLSRGIMGEENLRKQMMNLAKKMASAGDSMDTLPRLREKASKGDTAQELGLTLEALRESMAIDIDLNELLSSAEGDVEEAGSVGP